MHIYGPSAAISLEPDASLRIRARHHVEIVCLSGLLWVTRTGDVRDLFVSSGESLRVAPVGLTLVTALEHSLLRARELPAPATRWRWRAAARPCRTADASALALKNHPG
jgi:hypothetical protein